LAKLRYRKAAVQLLNALENDQKVEIIPVTENDKVFLSSVST